MLMFFLLHSIQMSWNDEDDDDDEAVKCVSFGGNQYKTATTIRMTKMLYKVLLEMVEYV